jgi:hypothetical protein
LYNVFNWRYLTGSRKEIQNLFYFLCDCLGGGKSGEYEIVSLRSRLGGGNKNFIQKKGEKNIFFF